MFSWQCVLAEKHVLVVVLCRTIDNNCQLFFNTCVPRVQSKLKTKKTRQFSGFFSGETFRFSSNVHAPLGCDRFANPC